MPALPTPDAGERALVVANMARLPRRGLAVGRHPGDDLVDRVSAVRSSERIRISHPSLTSRSSRTLPGRTQPAAGPLRSVRNRPSSSSRRGHPACGRGPSCFASSSPLFYPVPALLLPRGDDERNPSRLGSRPRRQRLRKAKPARSGPRPSPRRLALLPPPGTLPRGRSPDDAATTPLAAPAPVSSRASGPPDGESFGVLFTGPLTARRRLVWRLFHGPFDRPMAILLDALSTSPWRGTPRIFTRSSRVALSELTAELTGQDKW
jgi:hypothetical protein